MDQGLDLSTDQELNLLSIPSKSQSGKHGKSGKTSKSGKLHKKKLSAEVMEYGEFGESSEPNSRTHSRSSSFVALQSQLGGALEEALASSHKRRTKAITMLEIDSATEKAPVRSHEELHQETEKVRQHLATIKDHKTLAEEAKKKSEAERLLREEEERRLAEERAAMEAAERAAAEAEAKRLEEERLKQEELQITAERLHRFVKSPDLVLNNRAHNHCAVEEAARTAAEEAKKREEVMRRTQEERQKAAELQFQNCSRSPAELLGHRRRASNAPGPAPKPH